MLFDCCSRLHPPSGSPITCVVIAHPLRKPSRTWDSTASRANLFDYGHSNHLDALQGSEQSSISLDSFLINPNFVFLDDMGLVHFFKWQSPDVWKANVEFSWWKSEVKAGISSMCIFKEFSWQQYRPCNNHASWQRCPTEITGVLEGGASGGWERKDGELLLRNG